MRLFVAVSPPPDVAAQLAAVQDTLRTQGSGRFTDPENLHMTLVFLGETDRISDVISALSSLSAVPFSMEPAALGCFGDLYWLGMRSSPELSSLQKDLELRLREVGFSLENREFIPHITLARRFMPNEYYDPSHVENAAGSLRWPVSQVTLMESRQEHGKTVYIPLYEKAFAEK